MVRKMINRSVAGALVAACGVLVFLAAGCAGPSEEIRVVKDAAEFQTVVLESPEPVMVDFYKGGCPTCGALDPLMNQLAEEYRGRVLFARLELMKPYFVVTSEELKKKYDIGMYPTEVLFVNGQEKQRWALDYTADDYRKVLNEYAGAPPEAGPAPVAGAKPAG
jgi:thioredoxin 1